MIARRKPLPRSSKPIARKTRVKPVNAKRKAKNWSRAYGSVARVLFVKSLPCVYGHDVERCAGEIHNHHTRIDGAGRKGPADSIVPICTLHHVKLHAASGMLPPVDLAIEAELTETRWLIASGAEA